MHRDLIYENGSLLKWSTAFWKAITSENKVMLRNISGEKEDEYIKGYLSVNDVYNLGGGYDFIPIIVPVQYSVSSSSKKNRGELLRGESDGLYSRHRPYEYEVKYLKVYILKEELLNYLGFPISLHKKILNKELNYMRLDDVLKILPSKKEMEKRIQRGILTPYEICVEERKMRERERLKLKKRVAKEEKKKKKDLQKLKNKIKTKRAKGGKYVAYIDKEDGTINRGKTWGEIDKMVSQTKTSLLNREREEG